MEINVSNCQKKTRVSKKWVREVAATVLKNIGARGELSIVLVDNKYIRRLNRKYRHKDRATDVLSFQQTKAPSTALLGDVIISVERARSQSKRYGHSFKDEMAMLLEHGILHLLGLTHAEMNLYSFCRERRK